MIGQEVVTVPNTAAVWIALIGSLTTLGGLIITQLINARTQARRGEEQAAKMEEQTVKIEETHELVNSKHDEALREIRELKGLLKRANQKVDDAEKAASEAKAEARALARRKAAEKKGKDR